MMKRKHFLYALYCIVIIGAVLTVLIIFANKQTNASKTTGIELSTPREIVLELDNQVILADDFITTDNGESIKEVSYLIYTKAVATSIENLIVNDLTIKANEPGFYYIEFYITLDNGKKLKDILVIHAVSNGTKNYLELNNKALVAGNQYSVDDILKFNYSNLDYNISFADNNVKYQDNKIVALHAGTTKMYVDLLFDHYTYRYNFDINITEPSNPTDPAEELNKPISLIINGNEIMDVNLAYSDIFNRAIYYEIYIDGVLADDKSIVAISMDEDILNVVSCDYPIIAVKTMRTGSADLQIYYHNKLIATFTVNIN